MVYRDVNLTWERCGQVFSWPGWAQEWQLVTKATQAPTACVACRMKAGQARVDPGIPVPTALWAGLPLRTVTQSGMQGDPITIALVGAREEVLAAFAAIGARPADPLSLRDDLHLVEETVRRGPI